MQAIGDFIARYGLLSGLGVTALVALATLVWRRVHRERGDGAFPVVPLDFDLIPLWFEVSLYPPTPEVFVHLQAVNYLRKDVVLDEIKVGYFKVNIAPHLENIVETDYRIPGRQSRQIRCRRRLIDSEIRGFANVERKDRYDASVHVSARGTSGRRTIKYVNTSHDMHGWINGLPTPPTAPKPS